MLIISPETDLVDATKAFADAFTKHLRDRLEGAGAYLCRSDQLGTSGEYFRIADDLDATLERAACVERNRERARLYEMCERMAGSVADQILASVPDGEGRLTIATVRLPIVCHPRVGSMWQTTTTRPQLVTRATFGFSFELDAYEMTTDVLYGVVREK